MRQSVDLLRVGDVISEDTTNYQGVLLLSKGAVLGEDTIRFIKEQGIRSVEIDAEISENIVNAIKENLDKPPLEYNISEDIISHAIDERSSLREQYNEGLEAIRNIDISVTGEIARDICSKIVGVDNLQAELSMLKQGCDSVLTHSMNVAVMTATLIVWDGNLTSDECYDAVTGAMLHDIGKLYIPRQILEKPSKLTADEYTIMQQHPELGYMKLRSMGNVPEKIARMAYEHHENADGTGYPRHAKGEEICVESRIIHVADVYEAMTARRCYKPPMLPGDVTEYTMSRYGTMFDEKSVKTFLRTVPAYKIGDTVMLSNHELAEVTECNIFNSLRPKIRLLRTGEVLDLYRERKNMNITIVEVV